VGLVDLRFVSPPPPVQDAEESRDGPVSFFMGVVFVIVLQRPLTDFGVSHRWRLPHAPDP